MSGDRLERLYFILRLVFLIVWFVVVGAAIVYFSRGVVYALADSIRGWFS